jgi:hypothetical protein
LDFAQATGSGAKELNENENPKSKIRNPKRESPSYRCGERD